MMLAAVLALLLASSASAQGPDNRVGLVVQFGSGAVFSACYLYTPGMTGLDLLRRMGQDPLFETQGQGVLVCRITAPGVGSDGCDYPRQPCLCQASSPVPPWKYWAYWRLQGNTWVYSDRGAAGRELQPGAVDGWGWGEGTTDYGVRPPAMTFGDICPAPTLTPSPYPTATFAPPPTPLPTQPPTDTPTVTPLPPTPTFTPLPPTATAEIPTDTPVPGAAPTETSTPIVLPALPTAPATATATPVPGLPSNTPTPAPPSPTSGTRPIASATPTAPPAPSLPPSLTPVGTRPHALTTPSPTRIDLRPALTPVLTVTVGTFALAGGQAGGSGAVDLSRLTPMPGGETETAGAKRSLPIGYAVFVLLALGLTGLIVARRERML